MFTRPGVAVRTNPYGISLVFLHYSADPDKGNGVKALVAVANDSRFRPSARISPVYPVPSPPFTERTSGACGSVKNGLCTRI
jgi:hypothetical protein